MSMKEEFQFLLRFTILLLIAFLKEGENLQIKYSPDADVLIIRLREEKPVDSRDMAEGVILHLSAKGQPIEIEVLDAARVIQKKDIVVSLDRLFPATVEK